MNFLEMIISTPLSYLMQGCYLLVNNFAFSLFLFTILVRFLLFPFNVKQQRAMAKNAAMLELDVKPEWAGKNLIELNLRKKYSVNVVALRRDDMVSVDIDPHAALQESDKLIVIANPRKLAGMI